MLTEPYTGLRLIDLAILKDDEPFIIPNLNGLKIVATSQPENYKGTGIELPQIPGKTFIIFKDSNI